MNKFTIYLALCAALVVSSQNSCAQSIEFFNGVFLDSNLIKEHQIRSLTVYSDYAQGGLESSIYSIEYKWKEVAFNEEGQKTFEKSAPLFSGFGELDTKLISWEWIEYDSLHRAISNRTKQGYSDQTTDVEYNSDNQILKSTVTSNGEIEYIEIFEWDGPKLINYNRTQLSTFYTVNCKRDEQGEIVLLEYNFGETQGSSKMEYSVKQRKETIERSIKRYQRDKYKGSIDMIIDRKLNTPISVITYDDQKTKSTEMKVLLDDRGNIVRFESIDFEPEEDERTPPPAPKGTNNGTEKPKITKVPSPQKTIYQIENSYDDRGLLIKQKYFKVDGNSSKKTLVSVLRFFYETEELIIQPLPEEDY